MYIGRYRTVLMYSYIGTYLLCSPDRDRVEQSAETGFPCSIEKIAIANYNCKLQAPRLVKREFCLLCYRTYSSPRTLLSRPDLQSAGRVPMYLRIVGTVPKCRDICRYPLPLLKKKREREDGIEYSKEYMVVVTVEQSRVEQSRVEYIVVTVLQLDTHTYPSLIGVPTLHLQININHTHIYIYNWGSVSYSALLSIRVPGTCVVWEKPTRRAPPAPTNGTIVLYLRPVEYLVPYLRRYLLLS